MAKLRLDMDQTHHSPPISCAPLLILVPVGLQAAGFAKRGGGAPRDLRPALSIWFWYAGTFCTMQCTLTSMWIFGIYKKGSIIWHRNLAWGGLIFFSICGLSELGSAARTFGSAALRNHYVQGCAIRFSESSSQWLSEYTNRTL